ncbi:MAG TPA: hypothetical protein VGC54_04365 [Planctomycetota bacterium]
MSFLPLRTFFAWALLVFLLLAAAAPASAQADDWKGCRRCDHRGVEDCSAHSPELLALEAGVLGCSTAARCPECGGALLVDCEKCEGGPESALIETRKAAAAAFLAEEDPIEAFLGRELLRIGLSRFALLADVAELGEGRKKTVDGHLWLHRLAADLDLTDRDVLAHYGATEKDYRAPMRLWFWDRLEDHAAVMTQFLFSTKAGDFKMLGRDPIFSVWVHDQAFGGDAAGLHALGVHNAAHMLLSNLFLERWIGDIDGGWFDAGAGHWYETARLGRTRYYCQDEAAYAMNYENGYWQAAVRRELGRHEARVLPSLVRLQTGAMKELEHAFAWSFYDWLVAERPQALAGLLRGLKRKQPARELFPAALEIDLFAAEDAWRAWVVETYPAKEPKRKR